MATDERFERLVRGVEGLVTLTAQLVSHFDGSSVERLHEMASAQVEKDEHLARAQIMERPDLFAALKERGIKKEDGTEYGGKTKTATLVKLLRDSYAAEAEAATDVPEAKEETPHVAEDTSPGTATVENTTDDLEKTEPEKVEEDAASIIDDAPLTTPQVIPPMPQLYEHLQKYCSVHGQGKLRSLIQEKIKPGAMKLSELDDNEKGLLYLAVVEVIGEPESEE